MQGDLEFYNVSMYDYGSEIEFRFYEYQIPCPGTAYPVDRRPRYRDAEVFEDCPFVQNQYGVNMDVYCLDMDELAARAAKSKADSMRRTINNLRMISRGYPWEWFCTFTFSPLESAVSFGYEGVSDRYDYDVCSGYMKKWVNNMKKQCPDLMYVLVPELHEDGAYHFHGLFAFCPALRLEFLHHKEGRDLYRITSFLGGHSSASAVSEPDQCAAYISKYITKDLCAVTSGKRRYWHSKNCSAPEPVRFRMSSDLRHEFASGIKKSASYVSYAESLLGSMEYVHLKKSSIVREMLSLLSEYEVL